jgi:hypothetical protein
MKRLARAASCVLLWLAGGAVIAASLLYEDAPPE